jgi:hypothetical protein
VQVADSINKAAADFKKAATEYDTLVGAGTPAAAATAKPNPARASP